MGNLIRAEWRRFKRDPFLWGIAAVGVAYGCYLARGTWGAELPREINSGDQTVPGAVWLLWQLPGTLRCRFGCALCCRYSPLPRNFPAGR